MKRAKWIACCLAGVLAVSGFAGCGRANDQSSESASAAAQAESAVAETPVATETPTPTATPTETPTPTPTPEGGSRSIQAEAIQAEPVDGEEGSSDAQDQPSDAENETRQTSADGTGAEGTEAASDSNDQTYRTVSSVNVRETPDLDAEIYTSLEAGTAVTVIGEEAGWAIVSIDGGTYYISQELLEKSGGTSNPAGSETSNEGTAGNSD